jgi:hypothetical protein
MRIVTRGGAAALPLALVFLLATAPGPAAAEPTLDWADTYDAGIAYVDDGIAAAVTPDGNLVVGGESFDGNQGSDLLIRKLHRETRQPLWSCRYPAFDGNDMGLSEIAVDPAGDVLVGAFVRGCAG